MAGDLLGIVLSNLNSFLQEELATIWGVDQQIQRLSSNVTAIRAVLKDADEKQITNHAVKDWLQKLTDATYVLDDILEECSIKSNQPHTMCLTHLNPMKFWSRRDIGQRMKELVERFDFIAEERMKFQLIPGIIESQPEDDEWRQTSSVLTEAKVYGRDQDKEQIVEFLLQHASNSGDLSFYSIVGIGGLGKTTLAQFVFNDERVTKHFDLKIWVCVSDDFNMMKILQSIVESATGQKLNLSTLEAMQKKVQEVLQSKRYLLVLDDVWNEVQEKWEKFKHILQHVSGTKGASVLVTTRLTTVASMTGTYPAHHLEGLSENDVWSLFRQHAFGPNKEDRAELVAIGKEIVKKCVGSPLAAKVLGSLLCFKREEHQWLAVKESKFWNLPEDNPIMSALRLSYFNMKLLLRQCFSFCAIFPKDFEMVKENLVHLWMANGFISSKGNLEVEHVGNEVWNELHQRSFFQEVKTDELGNTTFKMHDLVHDLAQSIMGEECVVSEVASLKNLSSRVHHIGFLEFYKPIRYNRIPFQKVESLRTFLEIYPTSENLGVLPSISPLRALRTSYFQLSALNNLIHLRYLNLYRSDVKTLPKWICRLQKLQILKLEYCRFLSGLPEQLTRLQDLRHLVIRGCHSLIAMPSKIGKLTSLKTLSVFIVGSKIGFGITELHNLQLGGKLHIKGLENVPSERVAKEANLIGKKDLNQLYLSWDISANSQGKNTEHVLEALEPSTNLKSFGMKGYMGLHLPSWMRNTNVLKNLVKVILYECRNCKRLPPLGKLPCLTSLYILGMKDIKYIDDDSYDPLADKAFTSLKKLILHGLPNLERMLKVEGVEMLPLLSHFAISGAPKLTLPCLPSIEYLLASGSNRELFKFVNDFYCNEDVVSFPKGIMQSMDCLKFLSIKAFNELKVLPDELNNFSALEELDIRYCDELESFPEHVLQGLTSLRSLSIRYCPKFKSLSDGMRHLTCLESFEILGCPQLMTLPSSMNELSALQKVRVSGNDKQSELPEGLEHITSLQSLYLGRFPCLTSLPDWLGAMTSLQTLEIYRCPKLRSLPDNFQQLRNLNKLHISYCPNMEKRFKQGVGEDWQKIAHIPDFNFELHQKEEETFCEKIISAWKRRKQFGDERQNYPSLDIFNRIVDDDLNL